MINYKYEITDISKRYMGHTLYRIKCVRDFTLINGTVIHKGDFGGWIERKENLPSHDNTSWIGDDAMVFDKAQVEGNAIVMGNATVYENTWVYQNAEVYDNVRIYGEAHVFGNAKIYGNTRIFGRASVYLFAEITGDSIIGRNDDYEYYIGFELGIPNIRFHNVVMISQCNSHDKLEQDNYGFIQDVNLNTNTK